MRVRLLPAESAIGVVFRREDAGGAEISARYDRVTETRLGTVVSANEASVAVVEHFMAAAAGAGLDDVVVVLDGPEMPILTGDALSWLELLDSAGTGSNEGVRSAIRVVRRVEVSQGNASATLEPAENQTFDFEITFDAAAIGTQRLSWTFSPEAFRRDIAPARTFGFLHELDALRRGGFARGASLENTLAIDGDRLVNGDLLRFADEFVRHKILDAIGDLALAGSPVIGRFVGRRAGHALNNRLLHTLLANPENYQTITDA